MRTAVVAICLLIPALPGAAQEFRGTIQGRVTDQHGAAIPHAPVLVTNEETGVASEALTEADGAYAAPFLVPGRYRVEVALAGFKKFLRSGIAVGVGQRAPVDVTLALGELAETVEVRAEVSLLDRASGALGQTGDVNMTLKSGTNAFRGQAWNFLKNERLNANDVLNASQGAPKPPYQANQYGATIRGPIVRGRTFYMGTFEGLRERVPFPQTASV